MTKKIKFYLKIFFFKINVLYELFFISKKRKQKFKKDLNNLFKKLKNRENFAFLRFSDGELFVLENKKLIISKKYWSLENKKYFANFSADDQKKFLPLKHQFYRRKLYDSLKFKKKNYFKGISCSCCNGKNSVLFMKNITKDDKNLTFSNLLQNSNYIFFIEKIVKLLKKRKIILISNKNHDPKKLPFKINKKFDIGKNCFINDYYLVNKVKNYINKNKIKNYVFLISASSLSNVLIFELFKKFDKNTYLDIGSTLNPYYNIQHLSKSRSYLSEYWLKDKSSMHLKKNCYW